MADVLVLNSNAELVDALKQALEDEGFTVATGHIRDLREDPARIAPLLAETQPHCIIFDIAPLYDANWRWFREHFCAHAAVAQIPIVVTTTNLDALRSFGVEAPVLELVGKPYDINQIVEVVERALAAYSDSSSPPSSSPVGSPA